VIREVDRAVRNEPAVVLVVDDEEPIRDLVSSYLVRERFGVLLAGDGVTALELARAERPDVVILDLNLPGMDGIEVCRQLRTFSDAHVLMLSARGEEVDRVVGLSIGADDYLVKPFSPRELMARVHALLRRRFTPPAPAYPSGLELDEARRRVAVDGRPIVLTVIEFAILASLCRQPGVVLSRQELLDLAWGPGYGRDDHLLDVHIAKLRRKLGDDPAAARFIETVRGVGFRLAER
jgi:DNA-binding response OmpR family regulator